MGGGWGVECWASGRAGEVGLRVVIGRGSGGVGIGGGVDQQGRGGERRGVREWWTEGDVESRCRVGRENGLLLHVS